jgi:aspartate dehydrogenase
VSDPIRRRSAPRRLLRIGIVGCGTIGSALASYISRHLSHRARLAGLCDLHVARARHLAQSLTPRPSVLPVSVLIQRSALIVEAASAAAVPMLVRRATAAGRDLLVMSAGGLLQEPALVRLAEARRCRLCVPSGALPGIDGIKAARRGRLRRIVLTTRKPPAALAGAPGLHRRRIALDRLRRPTLVFEGSPRQAVRAFPQNVNICATVALAAGRCPITVRVIAVPGLRRNVHQLEVVGDAGVFRVQAENLPDGGNPKTSRLAVLSATACLQSLVGCVRIGT